MKIIFKRSVFALAIAVASSTMVMANSIDIKIIGTISPSACTPALSGGGVIDYGVITANSLKKDSYTQLDKKQLDFSITCDAPTKVALRAINGRPSTAAGTTETGDNGGPTPEGISRQYGDFVVGLGLDGQHKIGGYNIALFNTFIDGGYFGNEISKYSSDSMWQPKLDNKNSLFSDKQILISYAKDSTYLPAALSTLSGTLGIQAYINKSSELDLTKPVKLDGLTTIELVYL